MTDASTSASAAASLSGDTSSSTSLIAGCIRLLDDIALRSAQQGRRLLAAEAASEATAHRLRVAAANEIASTQQTTQAQQTEQSHRISEQLLSTITALTSPVALPDPADVEELQSVDSWVNFCRLHSSVEEGEEHSRQSGEVFRDVPGVPIPVVAVLMSPPYVALRRRMEEMRQLMAFECAVGLDRKQQTQKALEDHLHTKDDRDALDRRCQAQTQQVGEGMTAHPSAHALGWSTHTLLCSSSTLSFMCGYSSEPTRRRKSPTLQRLIFHSRYGVANASDATFCVLYSALQEEHRRLSLDFALAETRRDEFEKELVKRKASFTSLEEAHRLLRESEEQARQFIEQQRLHIEELTRRHGHVAEQLCSMTAALTQTTAELNEVRARYEREVNRRAGYESSLATAQLHLKELQVSSEAAYQRLTAQIDLLNRKAEGVMTAKRKADSDSLPVSVDGLPAKAVKAEEEQKGVADAKEAQKVIDASTTHWNDEVSALGWGGGLGVSGEAEF